MEKTVTKKVRDINIYYHLRELKLDNVPKIVDIKENEVTYKYIEGANLREYLNNAKLNRLDRYLIGIQLIEIVQNINSNNIIHKDIKPENIIMGCNKVIYIIDFEVSRRYHGSKKRDTELFGTREYASPEHFGYKETDFRSDMYSLGNVFKDLDLGIEFDSIIAKACEVDPKNRFSSYNEMLDLYRKAGANILKDLEEIVYNNKMKKEETSEIRKIFHYVGYNFNNSEFQDVISILIGVLLSIIMITAPNRKIFTNSIVVEVIIVTIAILIPLVYIIDFIRHAILRIVEGENGLIKYTLRKLKFLVVAMIVMFILLVIFIEE